MVVCGGTPTLEESLTHIYTIAHTLKYAHTHIVSVLTKTKKKHTYVGTGAHEPGWQYTVTDLKC